MGKGSPSHDDALDMYIVSWRREEQCPCRRRPATVPWEAGIEERINLSALVFFSSLHLQLSVHLNSGGVRPVDKDTNDAGINFLYGNILTPISPFAVDGGRRGWWW